MAKLRGEQKFPHCLSLQGELWALERELDSMSQKGVPFEIPCHTPLPVNRQLGRVRSIILKTKAYQQKTLKRWINPAPNHELAMKQETAKQENFRLEVFT